MRALARSRLFDIRPRLITYLVVKNLAHAASWIMLISTRTLPLYCLMIFSPDCVAHLSMMS